MTELKRSIFVVPSSTLEDTPKRMGHEMAADFLSAWTAQWDPRLLVSLGTLPEWKKADVSALDIEDALVVCPSISRTKLDQPLRERLQLGRCEVLDSESSSRSEFVDRLLTATGASGGEAPQPPILLDDFYALGYAVLQIQILAKKLRYSWNIDWIMFSEQALSAAKASIAHDAEETERWLQTCFDSLSQERDRYCSQQAYLLDVVLLAKTTLGPSLDRQLTTEHPTNVLASSDLLQELKSRNAPAWDALKEQIHDKKISLVGGLSSDRPHPYLSAAAIIRDLGRGVSSYHQLGLEAPKVFSRYGSGFTATAPTWLSHFSYTGVLLNNWSEGVIPDKDQAKIRWQASSEGKAIDTVIGHVLDASSADSYIDLADTLSGQLDYHHVPTLVLAHWPGVKLQPLDDLIRVMDRSPALGKFHTAENYFSSTNHPYSNDYFPSNSFKLQIPESIAEQQQLQLQMTSYERLRSSVERAQSLAYLWREVAIHSGKPYDSLTAILASISKLQDKLDGAFDAAHAWAESQDVLMKEIGEEFQQLRQSLLNQVPTVLGQANTTSAPNGSSTVKSFLVTNPSCHSQRLFLEGIPGSVESDSTTRIYASETVQDTSNVVIDVPPFGFVRFRSRIGANSHKAPSSPIAKSTLWGRLAGIRTGIAQTDWTLANEFMEIQIDPKRGHLRSVYIANKRGSRLSGMASLVRGSSDLNRKWRDEDCIDLTNVQLRMVRNSALVGTIEVTGEAKQADGRVSKLTTRYTLWKGARWLDIEIVGDNVMANEMSCVWRTAWLNEGSTVSAWQQGTKGKLPASLQGTVELIEVDDAEHKIFLAGRGLSSHRRSESRFLISGLPANENGHVSNKIAIGMDWPRPYETALDFCDQPWFIESAGAAATQKDEGAWLAQCNLSNVHVVFDSPRPTIEPSLFPADEMDTWTGRDGDACVWIREAQGKSGNAKLSFFRDVESAWRVDSQGREFDTLTVIDGKVTVFVQANEQSRILVRWKRSDESTPKNSNAI